MAAEHSNSQTDPAATSTTQAESDMVSVTAPGTQPVETEDRALLQKVSIRLLPFLFLLYILSYLDRINVSFAGLQMNEELGFSADVFGFGASIFFIGYFLCGIPSNLMVQKFGARRWIAAIMLIWGCISVSMALTHNATEFYLLRFLLGVAEAGFFPGMILYLTYWFPKRQHGTAVAKFMSAIPVAGVLGGLVSSKLLEMNGILGLPGWKWLFIATGAPSVILSGIVWFYLADGPKAASWLTNDEKHQLLTMLKRDREANASASGSDNSGSKPATTESQLAATLLNGQVWHLALIYFCLTLGMYGFQLWLPQIIHGFGGLSDSTTASLSAIPAVFQAIGMLLVARSSDKSGERRFHLAVSATLAAIALTASTLTHDKMFALTALSFAALGIWGTVGPFWAMPTGTLPPARAAAGIALINSVGNLGGFVGPNIIGMLKSYTSQFSYALIAMAGFLCVAGVLAVYSPQTQGKSRVKGVPE